MAEEDNEYESTKAKVIEAINVALSDTRWGPDQGAMIMEALVIVTTVDVNGNDGFAVFPATHHYWSTLGLLEDALEQHKRSRNNDTSD